MKKLVLMLGVFVLFCSSFVGCAKQEDPIIIYSCANDARIADMTLMLHEQFPDYEIMVEYQSTSKLAAKLLAEGTNTDCDIIHDLAYLNLDVLERAEVLADLSDFDRSIYVENIAFSDYYLPEVRTGGAIIVNTKVLEDRGLVAPASYEDLLNPEYKGLISMPDPKASSTGYMFLKALVNGMGEEEAFEYFEKLSENILQFTSSGNGPVNALVQQEVAIGLGIIANGAVQISEGAPLEIIVFDEGAPYSMYGQSVINGKEIDKRVMEVFEYLVQEYNYISCEKYVPELVYKGVTYDIENYPKNINYADMSNNTTEEKERLLSKWGSWN